MYAGINLGILSNPSMTKAIIMGLHVGPRIAYTSQSNRDTQGHHLP